MTQLKNSNNVEQVVTDNLCIGCGTCDTFCPEDAIELKETPAGYLKPIIDSTKCTACGICLKVCPGNHAAKGLHKEYCDNEKGCIKAAFIGKTTDAELLASAQSGGVATTLLNFLSEKQGIDRGLVTVMPKDKSLRPLAQLTSDRKVIMDARGSKYCPVALNAAFKQAKEGESVAMVGLPCQVLGLRNAQEAGLKMPCEIKITIGLICDRILSFRAIDYLIERAAVHRDNVLGFEYRSKKFRGWPGDVRITMEDGTDRFVRAKERMLIKDVFTPVRCHLCFDKFNIFSDIVLGDARGLADKKGVSVIIARTFRGLRLLEEVQNEGLLTLKAVSPEKPMEGQKFSRFQIRWKSFTNAWQTLKKKIPDFGIHVKPSSHALDNYVKELRWAMYFDELKDIEQAQKEARNRISRKRVMSWPILKQIVQKFGYMKRL